MRHSRHVMAAVVVAACLAVTTAPASAGTAVSLSLSPSPSPTTSAAPGTTSPSPAAGTTTAPSTEVATASGSPTPPAGTGTATGAGLGSDVPNADVPAAAPRSVALVAPTSTVVLRTVALTGVVEGDPAAAIALERRVGTAWAKVAGGTVAPTGEWAMSWVADTPGTVQLRASTTYADGATVSSAAASMLVVAAVDAVVSGQLVRSDVPTSYRNGCPVTPDRLRRLVVNYWDYHGKVRRGTLVVLAAAVPDVRRAFTRAFKTRFQVKKIVPVDAYYGRGVSPTGSDVRAMNDGNTSAFNCRGVTGSRFRVSQHSYGNAIDINTFENPYITSSHVYPAKAKKRYVKNRSKHLGDPGVLRRGSVVTRVFLQEGWGWGGFWGHRDWQHFSANGH